jgi:hypothetical protein
MKSVVFFSCLAKAFAASVDNTVLVFGDSWGDTGPTYKEIQDSFKRHGTTGTVKSSAVGGTTACGWAKDPQALVKAARKQFPNSKDGPDFVWYTAGGNDLIDDKTFHSCTKNAKSMAEAQHCYVAATDIAIACTKTMFDAYWKVFPKSQIMECNYDIPCENILCRGFDTGYLGNYCGSNITCLNEMGVVFQEQFVGRLRQMYPEPQYTGLLIGGAVQKAAGIAGADVGKPVLDKSGPCDMEVLCVHPKYGSKAGTAVGEAFWDLFFSKYVTKGNETMVV